jgi:hypothetical protein
MCDLLLSENGHVSLIQFAASEPDLEHTIRLPWVGIGSDGTATHPDRFPWLGKPHPRHYGTFPRVLAFMCVKGSLSLFRKRFAR